MISTSEEIVETMLSDTKTVAYLSELEVLGDHRFDVMDDSPDLRRMHIACAYQVLIAKKLSANCSFCKIGLSSTLERLGVHSAIRLPPTQGVRVRRSGGDRASVDGGAERQVRPDGARLARTREHHVSLPRAGRLRRRRPPLAHHRIRTRAIITRASSYLDKERNTSSS